jgi:hypothetical protein
VQEEVTVARGEIETIMGIYSVQEVKLAQHEAHITDHWTSVNQNLERMHESGGGACDDNICKILKFAPSSQSEIFHIQADRNATTRVQEETAAARAEMETIKGIYSAQEIKLAQHEVYVTQLWASVSQKLEHMHESGGGASADSICERLDVAIKAIKDRLDVGRKTAVAFAARAREQFQRAGDRILKAARDEHDCHTLSDAVLFPETCMILSELS